MLRRPKCLFMAIGVAQVATIGQTYTVSPNFLIDATLGWIPWLIPAVVAQQA
jgi:hypothetical protein